MDEGKGQRYMIKTTDISGMGGDYEATVQKMLTAGLKYLSDHSSFDWKGYKQFSDITGICLSENEDAKALDKVLLEAANGDCTGAMHQATVNHLAYIAAHSYSAWVAHIRKHRNKPGDIYDLDDTEREALVLSVEGKLP